MDTLIGLTIIAGGAYGLYYFVFQKAAQEPAPQPEPTPTPEPEPEPLPVDYLVQIVAGAGGTTNPLPSTYYVADSTILTVTAFPQSGYVFNSWSGSVPSTVNPLVVLVNQKLVIQANFTLVLEPEPEPEPYPSFQLKIESNMGGSVSPNPGTYNVYSGAEVILTATPYAEYEFVSWSGGITSTANPLTFIMDRNITVKANFQVAPVPPPPPTPSTVTMTLKPYKAPGNAVYWIAMCDKYPQSQFYPLGQSIVWQNIPPSTSQDYVIFGCYDAALNMLTTPNAWNGIGFAKAFENGKTYYWDFSTGILLDQNYQWM